jgi:hypothetical protein
VRLLRLLLCLLCLLLLLCLLGDASQARGHLIGV